ncbi:MAG: hypothetical protein A2275_13535 [Bacteroidetes bacterium RIFOXYA12_FULL_35_11]|nr:MAG: hypothetical protein A2275_13535 [Bacteroidetes bacterium RIFOXYA12_FULL_35_11]
MAFPENSTNYIVNVIDSNGCQATATVFITVQQPPDLTLYDTTIVVGTSFVPYFIPKPGVIYQWEYSDDLSCTDCPNPEISTMVPADYFVMITDSMNCFQITRSIHVDILNEFTIDVPKAFTPNGDNSNDVVYVRGWGLKRLIVFSIFNRWGEMVFQTDNLLSGWDGTYKGAEQNMDTYSYVVKAETYDGRVLTKQGFLILIR